VIRQKPDPQVLTISLGTVKNRVLTTLLKDL
jgi:hypothetical protein